MCRLVTWFDSPPMPWSLPLYAEAIAVAATKEVSPKATPKRQTPYLRALEYMDVEAVEDSHESESESGSSSDAYSAADIVGSN